jgi:hypothetical protein
MKTPTPTPHVQQAIEHALSAHSPARLWLCLLTLAQRLGLKLRPEFDGGHHVTLGAIRLTRHGGTWITADRIDPAQALLALIGEAAP